MSDKLDVKETKQEAKVDRRKAWISSVVILIVAVRQIATAFGYYLPNIEDIPTDWISNVVTGLAAPIATWKLARSKPIMIKKPSDI